MYHPHPSQKLSKLFSAKPYQGVLPDQAKFLFIGLDANYSDTIETDPIFSKILEYHDDGAEFWRKYGVHHPFLLTGYKGIGSWWELRGDLEANSRIKQVRRDPRHLIVAEVGTKWALGENLE